MAHTGADSPDVDMVAIRRYSCLIGGDDPSSSLGKTDI